MSFFHFSLTLFFLAFTSNANEETCLDPEVIYNGNLSYSCNITDSVTVSYMHPDGSEFTWLFTNSKPSAKITISASNKQTEGWSYLMNQQVILVPNKTAPKILTTEDKEYPKNADSDSLYILLPNNEVASINKNNGKWVFTGQFRGNLMTPRDLALQISDMKNKLDDIQPDIRKEREKIEKKIKVLKNSKPPKNIPPGLLEQLEVIKKKYTQQNIMQNQTRVLDIFDVQPSDGIVNFGTRFGTPPTEQHWGQKRALDNKSIKNKAN